MTLFPSLAYAFTVGMVATVNPCGFAMLPLYLAHSAEASPKPGRSRVAGAVGRGIGVSGGFVVVFGLVGLAVSAGLSALMASVPWVMVGLGALLALVGISTAAGWHPSLRLPGQSRLGALARQGGWRRSLGFGAAYAFASLTCSLPVFLAGVARAFTRVGFAGGVGAFLAYGLGMGVVFTALAVAAALAGIGFLRRGRRWGARLQRPLGGLVALVGTYLVYYWVLDLTSGGGRRPLVSMVERAQAAVAGWVGAGGLLLAGGLVAFVMAVAVAALGAASRRRSVSVPVPVAVGAGAGRRQATAGAGSPLAGLGSPASPDPGPPGTHSPPAQARLISRHHWRTAGVAAVAALVAVAVPGSILAWAGRPGPQAEAPRPSSGGLRVAPAIRRLTALDPFSGSLVRPAPPFALTDQHGRGVSLASFRGKAVVLSFNDNHCTDVCPLYAQDVRAADADLGPLAKRVAFVGVNTNPFYPSPAADAAFDRREHLDHLGDWHYLTGSPAQLARIWHAYGIEVLLDHHNRTVQHGTAFYLIGPRGRLRALGEYGWSSVQTARWGNALATMAAQLLGVHRAFPAHLVTAGRPQGLSGGQAPDFSLPSLRHPDTTRVGLAGFAGHPLVINFFASWCSACRAEAPALERLARREAGRVNFVGIDVDDQARSGRGFLRSFGTTYPVGSDPRGVVAADYHVKDLPTTVVVSPGGKVLHTDLGEVTGQSLGAQLARFGA